MLCSAVNWLTGVLHFNRLTNNRLNIFCFNRGSTSSLLSRAEFCLILRLCVNAFPGGSVIGRQIRIRADRYGML